MTNSLQILDGIKITSELTKNSFPSSTTRTLESPLKKRWGAPKKEKISQENLLTPS
jgi:hypothetical protein